MATVRRRKWTYKGVTKEAWVVSYTDQEGKRRQGGTFEKKKDADRERLRIETEIEGGVHTAIAETATIKFAADQYLRDCERRRHLGEITGASVISFRNSVMRHIVPALGTRLLSELRTLHVQDAVDKWAMRYKAKTVWQHYSVLIKLLNFAVRREWIKRNILNDRPPIMPRVRRQKARVPSKAHIIQLLEALENGFPKEKRLAKATRRVMVTMGLFGGLRRGEICGLQWEDVDFDQGIIHVRNSLSYYDGLKCPKTRAGVRDVPMSPPIRDALYGVIAYWLAREAVDPFPEESNSMRSWRLVRAARALEGTITIEQIEKKIASMSGFVLTTTKRGPLRVGKMSDVYLTTLMKAAGLTDDGTKTGKPLYSSHSLRHAAASLFIEAGLPVKNLQTVIGHASVSTTYDIYGHLFPEDERTKSALNAVAAQFDATRGQQIALTS